MYRRYLDINHPGGKMSIRTQKIATLFRDHDIDMTLLDS